MLFGKFWGVAGNVVSLNWYNNILKQKYIYKKPDNNSFYYTNKFFHVIIKAMVVTLCIRVAGFSTIDKFKTLIARFD